MKRCPLLAIAAPVSVRTIRKYLHTKYAQFCFMYVYLIHTTMYVLYISVYKYDDGM